MVLFFFYSLICCCCCCLVQSVIVTWYKLQHTWNPCCFFFCHIVYTATVFIAHTVFTKVNEIPCYDTIMRKLQKAAHKLRHTVQFVISVESTRIQTKYQKKKTEQKKYEFVWINEIERTITKLNKNKTNIKLNLKHQRILITIAIVLRQSINTKISVFACNHNSVVFFVSQFVKNKICSPIPFSMFLFMSFYYIYFLFLLANFY